jgi:hypothetical protein
MSPISKVRALSNWLFWLSSIAFAILPLVAIGWIAALVVDPTLIAASVLGLPEATAFTRPKVVFAGAILALVILPVVFALWQMRRLFGRYRTGDVLTADAAEDIRRIGLAFVVIAALKVVIPTLVVLVLTANNPPGQRALSVGVTSDSLAFLLTGGLLTVIGWAMVEAARAVEENARFV